LQCKLVLITPRDKQTKGHTNGKMQEYIEINVNFL